MRTEGGEYRIIQKSLLSLISRASVVSISGEDHGVKSVSKFLWVFQYLGIFVSQHSVFSIFQYLCISLFQYISVSQFKDDYAHFPGEQMDKSCQCCHWAGCKGGRTRTQKAWEFLINISRQHLDVGYMINPDSFYSGLWKRRFTSGLAEVSAPPLLQGYKSSQGEISWDLSNLAIIQLLLYSHRCEVGAHCCPLITFDILSWLQWQPAPANVGGPPKKAQPAIKQPCHVHGVHSYPRGPVIYIVY